MTAASPNRLAACASLPAILALLCAQPGVASGISLVSIDRNHSAQVALGGGIWEGNQCVADPDCQDQALASGAGDPALPVLDTAIATVAAFPNTDNALGSATARVNASFPRRSSGLFSLRQGASVSGRDAVAGGFTTTLEANAASTSTVVIDTSLSLAPSQGLEMTAALHVTHDGVAVSIFSGTYEIVDLDTGEVLASLALGSAGPVTLDISDLVGHRLQALFSGEAGVSLPAGFGGGAAPLIDRDFFHNVEGQLTLQIVPEPGTGLLLALGVLGLAGARRREARPPR